MQGYLRGISKPALPLNHGKILQVCVKFISSTRIMLSSFPSDSEIEEGREKVHDIDAVVAKYFLEKISPFSSITELPKPLDDSITDKYNVRFTFTNCPEINEDGARFLNEYFKQRREDGLSSPQQIQYILYLQKIAKNEIFQKSLEELDSLSYSDASSLIKESKPVKLLHVKEFGFLFNYNALKHHDLFSNKGDSEDNKVTEKQIQLFKEKYSIIVPIDEERSSASKFLDFLETRQKNNLATAKQLMVLHQNFKQIYHPAVLKKDDILKLSKVEATALIQEVFDKKKARL